MFVRSATMPRYNARMTEARPDNLNREPVGNQAGSQFRLVGLPHYNAKKPEETSRLLTLSEATETFGVSHLVIYALANAGLVDALQRDGRGRVYYSETQIRRALAGQYRLSRPAA